MPASSYDNRILLSTAGERDRETLQSTRAGTMVQCEKSSIAAPSLRGSNTYLVLSQYT